MAAARASLWGNFSPEGGSLSAAFFLFFLVAGVFGAKKLAAFK